MEIEEITREELHLAYRVVDSIATARIFEPIAGHILAAAAEVLRLAYREQTTHDPLPGQLTLP